MTTVLAAAEDPDPSLRRAALGALARLGALSVSRLRAALIDTDADVRLRALTLAARHDRRRELIDDVLAQFGHDTTTDELAAFVLGEIEDPTEAVVATLEHQARHHGDPLARESAVAALGALHRGRETILAALDDKATVRRRAVLALAPFAGPDIDAALATARRDRDWQVRQAAEDLLADDPPDGNSPIEDPPS